MSRNKFIPGLCNNLRDLPVISNNNPNKGCLVTYSVCLKSITKCWINMAPDVNVRKPPGPVTFDCCKDKPAGKVCVCILCEILLHISCSERKGFRSFGGVLGLCGNCDNFITAKPTDVGNNDILTLISLNNKLIKSTKENEELKLKNEELKLQNEEFQTKLKKYKLLHTEVKENLDQRIKLHDREVETMNVLVKEMDDKNNLLVEKIEKLQNDLKCNSLVHNTISYAAMASKTESRAYLKVASATPIIVAAKDKRNSKNTKTSIENLIKPSEIKAQIVTVKELKSGEVKIVCSNNEFAEKILVEINSGLADTCSATFEKLNLPKLKVVGINTEYEKAELEENLRAQNFAELSDKVCNVTYIQKMSKNKTELTERNEDTNENSFTAYLDVDPSIYHKIMLTGKVYIGWQRCMVYEDLNMKRCYKCCGYGHSIKKCTNRQKCGFCSGEHEAKDCMQKHILQCSNCMESNNKYHTKRSFNHSVFDHDKCETYKSREIFLRTKINYSLFSQ